MGGVAKGLLLAPGGEPIVTRLDRLARSVLGDIDVVLVGEGAAYSALGIESLEDDPSGIGPLGGLSALLQEGARRGAPWAMAIACDMPFVSETLLAELATFAPEAAAVAPRCDGIWEPLFARYEPASARVAVKGAIESGRRSLYSVLDRLGTAAVALPIGDDARATLRDWDEPGDVG